MQRICFICDGDTTTHVRNKLLNQRAYALDFYSNAESAIEALMINEYDVLVSDVANKENIKKVIHSVRHNNDPARSSLPVLVVIEDADARGELQRFGANEVLLKPLADDVLENTISTLLPFISAAKVIPHAENVVPIKEKVNFFERMPSIKTVGQRTSLPSLAEALSQVESEITLQGKAFLENDENNLSKISELDFLKKINSFDVALDYESTDAAPLSMMESIQQQVNEDKKDEQKTSTKELSPEEKMQEPLPEVQVDLPIPPTKIKNKIPVVKVKGSPIPVKKTPVESVSLDASKEKNISPDGLKTSDTPHKEKHFLKPEKEKKSSLMYPKNIKYTFFALLLVFVGVFVYFNQQTLVVDVVSVNEAMIKSELSVSGRVTSKRNLQVSVRRAGQVAQLRVLEGDHVKKGQLLVRLDDKEAKNLVKQEMARLVSSREDVAAYRKAHVSLVRAFEFGAVTRRMVSEAEAVLKAASAKKREIEEELVKAKVKLDYLQIKAPFDGVIGSVFIQEGQWLATSENALTLVDMNQRIVEFSVNANNGRRLNIDQSVQVSSQSYLGEPWEEKIKKIDEANDGAETTKVQTTLERHLKIGQQVDVTLWVASREQALQLPHRSVFFHEGASHVAIVENGKIVFVPVVTGIEGAEKIEIISGLRVAQSVIMPNGVLLEPGMSAIVRPK